MTVIIGGIDVNIGDKIQAPRNKKIFSYNALIKGGIDGNIGGVNQTPMMYKIMKNLTVRKSNRVIEAGFKLSLVEQKVLLTCIAKINRSEIDPSMGFELSVDDLVELCGTKNKNEYRDLQLASKRLLTRIVTINNPFENEERVTQLKTHWVSSVAYIPEEAKIRLHFSAHIIPYLSQLSREFTQYNLKFIGQMTSTYGIRLYELLMQWKGAGTRDVNLDWFRESLQLDGKYPSIKDFKLYVLDPAVQDINNYSNLTVTWEQRKTGRRVTHLIFTFSEKEPATEATTQAATRKKIGSTSQGKAAPKKNAAKHLKELKAMLG